MGTNRPAPINNPITCPVEEPDDREHYLHGARCDRSHVQRRWPTTELIWWLLTMTVALLVIGYIFYRLYTKSRTGHRSPNEGPTKLSPYVPMSSPPVTPKIPMDEMTPMPPLMDLERMTPRVTPSSIPSFTPRFHPQPTMPDLSLLTPEQLQWLNILLKYW